MRFFVWRSPPQSTVHTEWRLPISGVNPTMMEKSSLVGEGGGCTPHPLWAYYHRVQSYSVRSCWESRNTPSISSLPYMYSVDPPSSPKPHVPHVFEVLLLNEFRTASLSGRKGRMIFCTGVGCWRPPRLSLLLTSCPRRLCSWRGKNVIM
jgi:hypothetical protein